MTAEQLLAAFIHNSKYSDLNEETIKTVKRQMVALCGALIAGSATNAAEAVRFVSDMGGKPEATVFIEGGSIPAHQAAFANATMGRALDIDDHIAPGAHIGSATIPASFAVAETVGGCTGKDFITAVATGTEVSLRLNLEEEDYAGFDPTGVCAVYSCAAAASKLMSLDETQILNALGLVSNKSGATFQNNIDGVLAVPVMEGWVAQSGVECARLAQYGITGPVNFLNGVYGYFHLFGRDKADTAYVTEALGKEWHVKNLNFKKYPSCGLTQGSTKLILDMMATHGFTADDVKRVEILVPPFTYKLVGHPFKIGENARVDAQFSVAYCVVNALMRAPVTLSQFELKQISDPKIESFIKEKVVVISTTSVERTHYSSDIHVWTNDGKEYRGQIDVPPGTPGDPMTDEEHRQRFYDCIKFSGKQWLAGREESILDYIETLESKDDIRSMIPLFLP